jgi:hypothetical protein
MMSMETKELIDLYQNYIMAYAQRNDSIRELRRQAYAERFQREPAVEGGSNLQLPLTRWVLDVVLERLFLSLFGSPDFVRVIPKALEDSELAEGIAKILNAYAQPQPVYLALSDALLLGEGVVRLGIEVFEERWGKRKKRKRPFLEWIPLENVYFFSPLQDNPEKRGVFWIHYMKKKAVAEAFDIDVKSLPETSETPFFLPTSVEEMLPVSVFAGESEAMTKVAEFYIPDDELGYRHVTYLPDANMFLADEKSALPFDGAPLFLLRLFPFGSGGLGALLSPIEEELTVYHNQKVDANTFRLMPIYRVVSTSPALRDKEEWTAGKKIVVDSPDDVTPLPVQELVTSERDENFLWELAKLVSGVNELLSGVPTVSGDNTAYEVEIAMAEGSVRFRRFMTFVAEWMRRIVQHELLLLQLMGDDEEISNICYPYPNPLHMIDPLDIRYRFMYNFNTILTNRQMEIQKWILLRNLLAQEPLFVENKQAQWYLLRQILTAFDVDYRLIIGEKPVENQNQTPIDIQGLIQTLRGGVNNAG